ncbi:hypothetical protein WA588_002833 [Blastocystis sp. NMH]
MNRNQHQSSQKRTRQYPRNSDDAWNRIRMLKPEILDKVLTVSDGEWIKLFFYLFRYRDSYTKSFLFTKDHMGQRTVQLQEGYDVGRSKMLPYIRVREFPQGNVTLHFKSEFLLKFAEMRSFFQAITKNFLQERTNVNLDSFYSTSYYQIKSFSLDLWIVQLIDVKCWKYLQKQSLRPADPLAEQQEHSLLEFWNSYLSPALYPRIFADYLRLSSASSDLSQLLQQTLEETRYRLQTLYEVPVLLYLNPPFMQLCRRLLAYLDRLRKAMYSVSFPQLTSPAGNPALSPEDIYRSLLEGPMDCDAGLPPPSRAATPGGLALSAKENPALLRRLGGELLLFAEWCQNRCAWRRRGYLAVVDELTRIIHASFAQAQIELYGSSRTGLMIPSSDVDLVVVDNTDLLERIAAVLQEIPWIREVRHIKGSVQVVKAVIDPAVMANTTLVPTLEPDLLVCDITQISTTHTGIITAVLIRNRLNRFWELTPLILFLKELLFEKQLNSAYEGGMNSVAAVIVVMAYHHQQMMHERLREQMNTSYDSKALDLGELIVGFLYFMGFEFNYITTGASADWGFFNRELVTQVSPGSSFATDLVEVLDPVNTSNNLGKSCFNIYLIKRLFRQTYRQLMDNIDKNVEHPLLNLLGITDQCISFREHYR